MNREKLRNCFVLLHMLLTVRFETRFEFENLLHVLKIKYWLFFASLSKYRRVKEKPF